MEVNGWKKIDYAKNKAPKDGVATLISDKIDLKTKSSPRNQEKYFIIIKVSEVHQEDLTVIDDRASIDEVSKHVKEKLTEISRK